MPVDFRASGDLLARIAEIVEAKAMLVGDEVEVPPDSRAPVWKLSETARLGTLGLGTLGTPELRNPARGTPESPSSRSAEIIFTSGATADPKGVTITHKNLLANIIPIEREIAKYRKYERPFHPIRFLNLLPLSHMFGQSMATFVPPMLDGTVVFSHGYSPTEILHQIKSRRISVLVCVPKVLDVLREHVERVLPIAAEADVLAGKHWSLALVALSRGASAVRLEVLVHRLRRGAARAGARSVLAQARLPGRAGLRPDRNRADRHAEPSVPRVARHRSARRSTASK